METKKYKYRAEDDYYVEATGDLQYHLCEDGYSITGGSLLGTGFEPYWCDGITLPGEIDGIPVTELNGTYESKKMGYLEAFGLKRIKLTVIIKEDIFTIFSKNPLVMECSLPLLSDEAREKLQEVEVTFKADKMRVRKLFPSAYSVAQYVTSISFQGEILESWYEGSCSYFSKGMFAHCGKLKRVSGNFVGDVLDDFTFDGCHSLVYLPNIKVRQMRDAVFRGCESLKSIHLHNGLKYMGANIFEGCIALRDIYIPDTVTSIGAYAFKDCKGLESIHLPEGITEIKKGMFKGCNKLKKVFLSDYIDSIEEEAFCGCEDLKSPWIPKNLKSIGARAFYGCKSIREITLLEYIEEIGEDAFAECPNIVIKCNPETIAYKYAIENKISYILQQ